MYLNCHTGFSFKFGTLPVKTLFAEAKRCGIHKLALTEINNAASYLELLRICEENKACANGLTKFGKTPYHLDIAVGIEFRDEDHHLRYICLARNNDGFERLNRFLSYHNREAKRIPTRAPELEDVLTIYPYRSTSPERLRHNEFIGVRATELIAFSVDAEAAQFMEKFVALHSVSFLPPEQVPLPNSSRTKTVYRDFNVHRLLRCIANNTLLSKLAPHQQADKDDFMITVAAFHQAFERCPQLVANAEKLLAQCSIQCEPDVDKNKKFMYGSVDDDMKVLREKTREGYLRIYKPYDPDEKIWNDRIEKELRIIAHKKFTSYYLITLDLIDYAKRKGFDFVGRGSGANSTVAYCLGITHVDPIELDLYFERFLNEERVSPPDFDIDFSWDNRDAIYDYLFQRHGRDHVCLLGTHVTYQAKSILRELAKVFGLPKEEIDALVENRGQGARDHIAKTVLAYAEYIVSKELPSMISIHAGGVLITEKPIYAYTATEFPPKSLPVSQFDMHGAEDFGIHKFDILSQRGLGHIKETVRHIKRNRGIDVDVYRFREFKNDPDIKALLRVGRTMGCFYVESPATRMLLGKLRCEDYLTLVAASSIIRPGVASSGMMKAYIERFHIVRQGGTYQSIHPRMDEILYDTYGVMVYQEDVIKVAHHFAGLSLTEADVLRRGMSGKYRSREEFQRVRDRFFEGCRERNYEPAVAERVWYEIESFAGYSFAKGHSASYAVESFQSLYLKAHFPLEFMVGVINNFGGFYSTEFYFQEARMAGANIQLPCVNRSEYLTSIDGKTIYMGFVHLKGLEQTVARSIPENRNNGGPYRSLLDFLQRVPIGLEQARILIRIGAFRFTGKPRPRLLWETMLFFGQHREQRTQAVSLFEELPVDYPLPTFEVNPMDEVFDEIELLGFTIGDPFRLLAPQDYGVVRARTLSNYLHQRVRLIGYLVTTKNTRTKTGQSMYFGTFYDCEGSVFDTVHFPDVATRFPFRGRGFYEMEAIVDEDFGVVMVQVMSMKKLPLVEKKQLPEERRSAAEPAIM